MPLSDCKAIGMKIRKPHTIHGMERSRSIKISILIVCLIAVLTLLLMPHFALAEEQDGVPLLVLMYHQLLPGKHSQYIVSPEVLEQDLTMMQKFGYTSVTTKQVIDYVLHDGDLPDKPVLITFDDGHYNNLYYGKEILQRHGFTALISVIGRFSETTTTTQTGGHVNYSYLTWEQIRGMKSDGVFEFGNHTYDMHNYKPRFGIGQKAGESDDAYRTALLQDVMQLQTVLRDQCGVRTNVFAFPFGKYSKLAVDTLWDAGFRLMLTCNEGVTTLKRNQPQCLHHVKRYNRSSSMCLEKVLRA